MWVPVLLDGGSHAISSVAFSLDTRPKHLVFDPDADSMRFPQGHPDLAEIAFDKKDRDGELDVVLGSFSGALHEGVLMEIRFRVNRPGALDKLRFSSSLAATFGDTDGNSVAGRTAGSK